VAGRGVCLLAALLVSAPALASGFGPSPRREGLGSASDAPFASFASFAPEPDLGPALKAVARGESIVAARQALIGTQLDPRQAPALAQQRHNLETTRQLLIAAHQHNNPLDRAVALALVANDALALQAGALPFPVRPQPDDGPTDAIRQLLLRHGAPPGIEADVERLNDLPPPVKERVTGVVHAFLAFDEASSNVATGLSVERTVATFDHDRDADAAFQSILPRLGPVLAARALLLRETQGLAHAVHAAPPSSLEGFRVLATPSFILDLGGSGNTLYTEDVALLIDGAGDDTYANNAGGSNIGGDCGISPITINNVRVRPGAAALIDLAGDDTYSARACGVNGGAFGIGSTGFVLDAKGNDVYPAGKAPCLGSQFAIASCGANGGAFDGGSGFLLDADGDDVYLGSHRGVNGGTDPGAGLLVDGSGTDTYVGGQNGVNGGSAGGYAALIDSKGDDTYAGLSYGVSGGAFGYYTRPASGFLVDLEGNDHYEARGAGTHGGAQANLGPTTGFLFDASGDDAYAHPTLDSGRLDGWSGTNGGGVGAPASGALIDAAGSDYYKAGHNGANGGASGVATGTLLDAGGDDTYIAGSYGVNGGAELGGVYACVPNVVCVPIPGAHGLLLDTQGSDHYADADGGSGQDMTVIPKGLLGAQIDVPIPGGMA
jgi:hypothetical protein